MRKRGESEIKKMRAKMMNEDKTEQKKDKKKTKDDRG